MDIGTYSFKDDLLYSKTHEWAKIEGDICAIGIDDYSQREIGEIAFIELPPVGSQVKQFGLLCQIESVKTVLDIFSPISGTIVETNKEIENRPDLLNTKPYESWICKVKYSDLGEKINLMSINEYGQYLKDVIDK
ncbi:MAG: glycine cleavage system protein H [Candidatus Methanofastidiosum methylothiophilum]|uniref:Glycine cleavage system protein H n=1 Tax=Candidatus Methanofastidiosum methylothiophilum TaxID=1705564 RepID=A0A150ISY2_9EURY|nr:MAG: glycine cleavage system protein H [Candidatus Methanofastidiosum methylthiophilus]KYC48063.1 MAG: glycine cleavage system protein H [Candidatus Methanofastidiosum methylthiophilus]KYC50454.1 MAG: glycine cleavage system protein H [Candidatus Methanofastidiosum methylthiophilus]